MTNMRRLAAAAAAACAAILVAAQGCGGAPADRAGSSGAPAEDLALLANLGRLASQRVQAVEAGATLQQVDVIPGAGRYQFRFVDASQSRVISATGTAGARAADAFSVTADAVASLAAPPSSPLDLGALRLGPDGVVAVMVSELGAATPRRLTLIREDEGLAWRVEVNGPRGIVRGTVRDETGQFVQEGAAR